MAGQKHVSQIQIQIQILVAAAWNYFLVAEIAGKRGSIGKNGGLPDGENFSDLIERVQIVGVQMPALLAPHFAANQLAIAQQALHKTRVARPLIASTQQQAQHAWHDHNQQTNKQAKHEAKIKSQWHTSLCLSLTSR